MTNLDLFDVHGRNGAGTSSTVVDDAAVGASVNSDIPGPILALEAAYRAELALRLMVAKQVDSINAQMNSGGYSKFDGISIAGREGIAMSSDNYSAYIKRVEAYARQALSIEGGPFTGSLSGTNGQGDELFNRFYYGVRRRDDESREKGLAKLNEAFSPVSLWREIYKSFDPDSQRRVANLKCAHCIRDSFGLLHGKTPEMKVVKARVEVLIRIWARLNHNGTRQLSYDSDLHELGNAMQQAMLENGIDTSFGYKFGDLCRQLKEHSQRNIISRERVDLGNGVDVVLGYETFKLYLPQEFANAVNMFLSEYPEDDS